MKKMTAMLFSLAVGLNTVSMAAKADAPKEQETDVLLIGGGIMSATLGTYLQELQPGPELARNLECFVDLYRLLDTNGTVLFLRRIVQFHECRMSGTGVIPAV